MLLGYLGSWILYIWEMIMTANDDSRHCLGTS